MSAETEREREQVDRQMRLRHSRDEAREFLDRRAAGRALGDQLKFGELELADRSDVLVLGLARGGVPVAWEIAYALNAPLDAMVVRKLGVPGREELAMGAVASGGEPVLNHRMIRDFGVSRDDVQRVLEAETRELMRREKVYREGRPPAEVTGKVVILVDDGLATGASMRVAVDAVRSRRPAQVIVAAGTAPESTCSLLTGAADEIVCGALPDHFTAVGRSYRDFTQVSDGEVQELLRTPTTEPD
ncbi:phosphoribosyltransferase [Williamsia muralis]|uniref:phosphoribosyltransferase n=1 Tax=Williamsia marianensis TaxID=85044 RepID=UPI000DE65ABC|nr:phosphoribosyltransferase [Williamsia marianensis]PVY29985.1 putative phosphoribosyltransferase [Williamsia marianensis]